jgi:hypothetical protein
MLQAKLDSLPIAIKYNPKSPKISLLVNFYDPRFDDPIATENPYWFIGASAKDPFLALNLSNKAKP